MSLAPTTTRLIAALDKVQQSLAQADDLQTENELMATHVRSAVDATTGEPVFTSDVLRLAFVDILNNHQPTRTTT
jgi:hypothetical protein